MKILWFDVSDPDGDGVHRVLTVNNPRRALFNESHQPQKIKLADIEKLLGLYFDDEDDGPAGFLTGFAPDGIAPGFLMVDGQLWTSEKEYEPQALEDAQIKFWTLERSLGNLAALPYKDFIAGLGPMRRQSLLHDFMGLAVDDEAFDIETLWNNFSVDERLEALLLTLENTRDVLVEQHEIYHSVALLLLIAPQVDDDDELADDLRPFRL